MGVADPWYRASCGASPLDILLCLQSPPIVPFDQRSSRNNARWCLAAHERAQADRPQGVGGASDLCGHSDWGKWGLLQPFMPLGDGHTCLYALTTLLLGDRNTLALASVIGTHSGLSYQRPRTFLVRPLLSKDLSQRPSVKVREVCHFLGAVFDNGPV